MTELQLQRAYESRPGADRPEDYDAIGVLDMKAVTRTARVRESSPYIRQRALKCRQLYLAISLCLLLQEELGHGRSPLTFISRSPGLHPVPKTPS
jgi:hypothetical protein